MSLTGAGPDDPQKIGVPICDLLAGMNGVAGVLAALLERERTGTGQVVRTSLLAAGISVHAFQGTRWTVGGRCRRPRATTTRPSPPTACSDAPTALCRSPWAAPTVARLCDAFGSTPPTPASRPTTTGSATGPADRLLERPSPTRDADCWREMARAGIPAGKVRTLDDVYACEQVASQGLAVQVDHARLGTVTLPGPPLRFFDSHAVELTRIRHEAPPVLGADGDDIRRWVVGDH